MRGNSEDFSRRTEQRLPMRHDRSRQLWALGLVAAATASCLSSPDAHAASSCDNPSRLDAQERTLCTLEGGESGGVRTTDGGTGLQVTEITTDLDWKNANKATIPWSKVVKIRSALDDTYELAVFDRDYSSDFSTGAKEGVATK